MIALYILAALLGLIALILFLPVSVYLKYDGDFGFKVKFAGIKVFEPKKKVKKKAEKSKVAKKEEAKDNRLKTSFKKLSDKHGFMGAIKEIFTFLKDCLVHLGCLLKTMRFKRVCLDLSVAGGDATEAAIQYGRACGIVYPVLSLLQKKVNIKYKKINIKSEFEDSKSSFSFSMTVNLQIIFLIMAGFRIYKEYKKFVLRNDL